MARDDKVIAFVLAQFEAMGATEENIAHERHRLTAEDAYYTEWCGNVRGWCS